MKVALILLMAGESQRMGCNKMLLRLCSKTPPELCISAALRANTRFCAMVAAVNDSTRALAQKLFARGCNCDQTLIVQGGKTRADSVLNALRSTHADIAVIHDAARCLITPELIDKSVQSAIRHGSGIVGVSARDTLRHGELGIIERDNVFLTQTPQTFDYRQILGAYERARSEGFAATDDCAVYEHAGYTATLVEGGIFNQKLTYKQDVDFFETVIKGRLK